MKDYQKKNVIVPDWTKIKTNVNMKIIPSLPKRDLIKEACGKLDIKDEKELSDIKTIF